MAFKLPPNYVGIFLQRLHSNLDFSSVPIKTYWPHLCNPCNDLCSGIYIFDFFLQRNQILSQLVFPSFSCRRGLVLLNLFQVTSFSFIVGHPFRQDESWKASPYKHMIHLSIHKVWVNGQLNGQRFWFCQLVHRCLTYRKCLQKKMGHA